MKKIMVLLILLFGVNASYAEWQELGNGFYYDTLKKVGEFVNYRYKITNIAYLNTEIAKNKEASTIGTADVSYLIGDYIYNCKDFTSKAKELSFYDSNGKLVYTHKDKDWQKADNEDQIKLLCSQL